MERKTPSTAQAEQMVRLCLADGLDEPPRALWAIARKGPSWSARAWLRETYLPEIEIC